MLLMLVRSAISKFVTRCSQRITVLCCVVSRFKLQTEAQGNLLFFDVYFLFGIAAVPLHSGVTEASQKNRVGIEMNRSARSEM